MLITQFVGVEPTAPRVRVANLPRPMTPMGGGNAPGPRIGRIMVLAILVAIGAVALLAAIAAPAAIAP